MSVELPEIEMDGLQVGFWGKVRKYLEQFHPELKPNGMVIGALYDSLQPQPGAVEEFLSSFQPDRRNAQVEDAVLRADDWEDALVRKVSGKERHVAM